MNVLAPAPALPALLAAALLCAGCETLEQSPGVVQRVESHGLLPESERIAVEILVLPPRIACTEGSELDPTLPPLSVSNGARLLSQENGLHRVAVDLPDGVRATQQGPAWCWAACAQMVHRSQAAASAASASAASLPDQAGLVAYFRGGLGDQTADLVTIMRAMALDLEPSLPDVLVGVSLGAMTSDRMIADLSRGELPVVGLRDPDGPHACVVTAVTYTWRDAPWLTLLRDVVQAILELDPQTLEASAREDLEELQAAAELIQAGIQFGNLLAIERVELFDPLTGAGRELTGAQFAERCSFVMTPSLARQMLEGKEIARIHQEDVERFVNDLLADLAD